MSDEPTPDVGREVLRKSEVPTNTDTSNINVPFCGPCLNEDNKKETASVYCLECAENLCTFCKNQHHRLKVTRNHCLVDVVEQETEGSKEHCSEHPGKTIDYFCEGHQCLCCPACLSASHSQCRDISLVSEAVKLVRCGLELHKSRQSLEALIQQYKELQTFNQRQISSLTQQQGEALKNVQTHTDMAKIAIEKHYENACKEINRECNTIFESFEENGQRYETIIETLETAKESLQGKAGTTEDLKMLINLKRAQSAIQTYGDYTKIDGTDMKHVSIKFIVDASFQTMIWTMESLGRLEVKSRSASPEQTTPLPCVNPKKKRAVPVGGHAVRISTDRTTCSITGAAFLEDGRLVLADYNNRCLKLFDQQCKFVCRQELTSRPQDLATISSTELATSMLDESAIQFFFAVEQLQLGRRVRTECQYLGLAGCPKTRHIFGTCSYKDGFGEIHIMGLNGQIVRAIGGTMNGVASLVRPTSIQVASGGKLLYVSDLGQNSVMCFNIDMATKTSRPVFTYSDRNLELRNGLALDGDGSLYVCSGNMTIHQVSVSGAKVHEVLTDRDGLGLPNCLTYRPASNTLLVAEFKENSVKLYTLV